jgi:hypothetical protein
VTRGDNNEYLNLADNDDPQFNPFNNPFIRVGNRFMKNSLKQSDLPIVKDQVQ